MKNRQILLKSLTIVAVISSLLMASKLSAQSAKSNKSSVRPNIIFILTDDHRADALGYVGNKLAHTPEMDKLAQSGTYFRKAMVTTPICAASRASILSGMYERTHKYTFQTGNIKDEYMQTAYPKIQIGRAHV